MPRPVVCKTGLVPVLRELTVLGLEDGEREVYSPEEAVVLLIFDT